MAMLVWLILAGWVLDHGLENNVEQVLQLTFDDVKGAQIHPYNATWYVRNKAGEQWRHGGLLHERVKVDSGHGQPALHWVQIMESGSGAMSVTNETCFTSDQLKPLKATMLIEGEGMPPGAIQHMELDYNQDSVTGRVRSVAGDEQPHPGLPLDIPMFDGNNVGLILAALPLVKGYSVRFPVTFLRQNTSYWVVARVKGTRPFDDGRGGMVTAWEVDTDWVDRNSGQVSAGGVDQAGGTYFVVTEPPDWYPHVPKYINATFDTELIPQLLPQPGDANGEQPLSQCSSSN